MSLLTCSFGVYYFSDPSKFTAKSTSNYQRITVTRPPGTDHCYTVGQVKNEAGIAAKIFPSSLKIFGLFLGDDIGLPRRYCPDEAIVPETVTEFSFQLVSFNQDIENEVVCKDEKAMELVYWEIKNQWGNYGFPFSAQVECNKAFFAMYKNITQKFKVSSSHILNFLQSVRMKSPIFTAHYYHVRPIETRFKENIAISEDFEEPVNTKMMTSLTYCYTTDIVAIEKMSSIKEGRRQSRARFHQQRQAAEPFCPWPVNISVALNFNQLAILDALGRTELMSLEWSCIKSLRMNMKRHIFIVDFLTHPQKNRSITIKTDCSSFLFSLSQHIISLKCPRSDEEKLTPLQLQAAAKFLSPLFNNASVSEKKLGHLIEEKYAKTPIWYDENEEKESQVEVTTDGSKNSDDLPILESRRLSVTEADTPTWNTMPTIKENMEQRSNTQDKSSSILQTPLSQLLPSHEIYNNCNMNNNQASTLLSSLSPLCASGANEITSSEVGRETRKILKSPLCPRQSDSSVDTGFKLEECGDQGFKGSEGGKKKTSSDTIPRLPPGKSTPGSTFKSSCARSQPQSKGKGANSKGGVLLKKDRSLS